MSEILAHRHLKASERLVPSQASFELTYKCNERCGHCYLSTYDDLEDGRPVLTLAEWKDAIDQLAQAGTLNLVFIGGEVLMHPQFWEIADYASQKNFALSMVTNGLALDQTAAQKMRAIGFYRVAISLYSLNPAVHDKMTRVKGSHFKTVRAIEFLQAHGIIVNINCLLTGHNIEGYFDLENWALSKNIQIQFDPQVTAKNDGTLESTLTRATPEQLRTFYRSLKLQNRNPETAVDGIDPEGAVCNQGRSRCAITMYGDVLTCLEVRDPIGNLRQDRFMDIWQGQKAQKLRSIKNKDLLFNASCGDGSYCDHCPGMAKAETGDYLKPVPFLMELAKIKREVALESQ